MANKSRAWIVGVTGEQIRERVKDWESKSCPFCGAFDAWQDFTMTKGAFVACVSCGVVQNLISAEEMGAGHYAE